MSEQKYGGIWTEKKLEALDKYLDTYMTIMKKQTFKVIYIDTFAGRGNVKLKDGRVIEGSSVIALKYSFNAFRFLELDKEHYDELSMNINKNPLNLGRDIRVINEDCNQWIKNIIDNYGEDWFYNNNWRGVMFLDPYAMNLSWDSLVKISRTKIFDVWYLFPFMAANRNLYNNGKIPQANKHKLNNFFGTDVWEEEIYAESHQISLFGEPNAEKVPGGLKQFALKRFGEIFPIVSPKAVLLRNDVNNSPMFLLCFMASNPDPKVKDISLRVADYILTHTDMERV